MNIGIGIGTPVQGYNYGTTLSVNTEHNLDNSISEKQAKRIGKVECETCKNRKYVDGSNEGDVSFKAPGHIDPKDSYSKVMSHELEHVANAKEKTAGGSAKLLSATVSLQMACCPECGRSYVAGGLTRTRIQYNKDMPYDAGRKTIEGSLLKGQRVDTRV